MNSDAQRRRRILVIANRTCPCPTLAEAVARRASAAPIDVLIVAPALNSRLRHWLSDVDEALARAQERLDLAITALQRRGIVARGEIGDGPRRASAFRSRTSSRATTSSKGQPGANRLELLHDVDARVRTAARGTQTE